MGVETRRLDTRRPPLPAPTESMDEQSNLGTEVATNVTTRTDKSSYSIPDDGSPITISTQKITSGGALGHHSRQKSQTSLLIEYFEASKSGDKSRTRPSVRVKVTPSSTKRSRNGGSDAIQITGIGKDRKPSYTRRISLGNKNIDTATEGTELSHSSGSNVSQLPPVEIEVLSHSDVSHPNRSSRGLIYAPLESNVSSMPPDSLLDSEMGLESEVGRDIDRDDDATPKDDEYLKAPVRSRSRSDSRERITQRVMEKLGATPTGPRTSSGEVGYEASSKERRRRPSKSQRYDDSVESSLVSSNPTASQRSYRSDRSQASRMTNNPKLLEMVEDTIKRVILPEINAIKEDRRADRNMRAFEKSRHGSVTPDGYGSGGLERRVSKSSSSPNIVSKPKVVLNREGDDPGTVLSRGDSERVKGRKSSREHKDNRPSSRASSGRHSRGADDLDKDEKASSRGSRGPRDAAAAALVGGALTAAALRSHDSRDDVYERRKRRSKSRGSRSRSVSNVDVDVDNDHAHDLKAEIPPMPLASQINESDVTRESILSQETEHLPSGGSLGTHTPIREVSRGSLGGTKSPASSRTPTRTSLSRGLATVPSNQFTASPRSSNAALSSNKSSRIAALAAAAGLGTSAVSDERHMDADGYGPTPNTRNIASPVQSVSSLKKHFEDDESLVPHGLRPRSAASRSSAALMHGKKASQRSLRSADSSPSTKQDDSHMHSRNDSTEAEYETPQERRNDDFLREGSGTPSRENMEEWLERQRQVNDRYRDSLGEAANRDSYQTNPYPQDEKRFTQFTEDSLDQHSVDDEAEGDRDVHNANTGLNPEFVHTPLAVESAVASLMEPSVVSSNILDSNDSATKNRGSYSERMAEQSRISGKRDSPGVYEGSTLSQNMPSQDRWAALKGYAKAMSNNSTDNLSSPRQSPAKSSRDMRAIAEEEPYMGASGIPRADDPMPEIGHFDDTKSLTTNPSIIQGPLGGDVTGNDTWPYTPEPQKQFGDQEHASHGKDGALFAAGAGAAALGAAAAAAVNHRTNDPDALQKRHTPDNRGDGFQTGGVKPKSADSPTSFRDKGYPGDDPIDEERSRTPKVGDYKKSKVEDYPQDFEEDDDDVFAADPRHKRTLSGNSHGMASPLYDSATGNGIDRIQSKDIVALMDHLTVRDAQRNARDTEILVTLVRSAAEMRQSFDEMKRFIVEQDKLIMQNTERGAEHTAQRVLGGPRPAPTNSPRTPRRETTSQEDIQTKRKGVLRRALKGLTGGKSTRDLARIEDMLMQVLDNVEDLKHQGGPRSAPQTSYTNDSLDSYERLRAVPDSTYQPEARAEPLNPLSQPGNFPVTQREKQQFHSGYDGRRGSENRVSTVVEDDEDEDDVLAPHESAVLNHQFENNERLLTPTQEYPRSRGFGSPAGTPPRNTATSNDRTPRTTEKERKHKSTGSSIFGMSAPKVSRWSKTTASSGGPDFTGIESPTNARQFKVPSEASRSGSALDRYDDEDDEHYDLPEDGRHRSQQSLPREQARNAETRSVRSQGSRLTRTPSPLIPSEASHRDAYGHDAAASPVQEDLEDDEDDFDDPKYQAVRNSLLLQHPQPRQGPTTRHPNNLETHAQTFEDTAGSNSDVSQRTVSDFDPAVWGSTATAGLARHRLTQFEPLSPVSMNSPGSGGYTNKRNSGGARDEGPLVPTSNKTHFDSDPEMDWEEPQFSNSGFSKGGNGGSTNSNNNNNNNSGNYNSAGYYSSPYGSGHLLDTIEEVRYSLETDRSNVSPEPQVAKAVPARKITGPRPMGGAGSRSSSAASGRFGVHNGHAGAGGSGSSYHPSGQARLIDMSASGTVRRKPVPYGSGASDASGDSETF